MDTKRLEDHKKWLDTIGAVYQRHADFMKLAAGGVVEYGKLIVQSLFALNGAGIIAVQFLIINLSSGPIKKIGTAYLWAGGFFLLGFLLVIAMSIFFYQHFSGLYKDGAAEYQDEMRIVHNYVFGNKDIAPDFKSISHQIELSYKMVWLMAGLSFFSFFLGCFTLALKISETV